MKQSIRILGIDPGARATGWAVIDVAGNSLSFVEAGVIRAKTHHDRPGRLAAIHQGLTALIERLCPVEAAVEQTFVNASPRDALVLGEARGVALCAPAACGSCSFKAGGSGADNQDLGITFSWTHAFGMPVLTPLLAEGRVLCTARRRG